MTDTLETTLNMREIARVIGWGTWLANYKLSNPEVTQDQISDAWKAVREEQISVGRRGLKALEKAGFKVVASEE
ncbi:hypothetical protein [Shimia thalassica]|uniref:hypothetical protein n=1 Tax=Shimia thalassica TaxID=1715693 RepID=UPI0026E1FC3C|nr:hypothetical protein [Shimia thalassica]MDO6481142.1 hypothetical protein [Shimia thalassica]